MHWIVVNVDIVVDNIQCSVSFFDDLYAKLEPSKFLMTNVLFSVCTHWSSEKDALLVRNALLDQNYVIQQFFCSSAETCKREQRLTGLLIQGDRFWCGSWF